MEQLPSILQLKAINLSFGENEVLRNINLNIEDVPKAGQFIVIMGKSGCGKSTLLKLISGLIKPSKSTKISGEIFLYGKPKPESVHVNMVFQKYSSFYWRSVLDNVAFGLELKGIPKKERNEKAMEMIKIIGLEGKENFYASDRMLSGGQLQRVAIGRSLLEDPNLLLLDEPFGALDTQSRLKMQNRVRDIVNSLQSTMILVTHDISEAVYLADDIYILSANPGQVHTHFNVNLGEKRDVSLKKSMDFLGYVQKVEDEMNSLV